MTVECQHCRRPDPQFFQLVSRHTTSEGVVVYARCACGALHRFLVGNAELRSWYHPNRVEPDPTPEVTAA